MQAIKRSGVIRCLTASYVARRAVGHRSALSRPVILLLGGSMLGHGAGVIASRLLAFLVYGATPRDPPVLAGALLTMTAFGLVAIATPPRALRVNPAQLLREE